MSDEIEQLIERDEWVAARQAIRKALRAEPSSHWLLSRLALTYYEQRSYARALEIETRAYEMAPFCPLVLWGLAGSLQMLGRHSDAALVYRRLIRRGVDRIADGACGEGRRRARGLVADCWYRLAVSYIDEGRSGLARRSLERHLALRGPGCESTYSIGEVRGKLQTLVSATRPN